MPIGMPAGAADGAPCAKLGATSEAAGGVKVGKRVAVATVLNCAASVGSIVDVAGGMGVGGGSLI